MKSGIILCMLAMSLLCLTGCWSRPGGVSPSTVAIASNQSYTVIQEDVKGYDVAAMLLTFPISHPDSKSALDNALKKYDADGLINVTLDTSYFSLIFFTLEFTTIRGDAIKIRNIN